MNLSEQQAADLLLKGEVIALPTETVYGLAGLATNPLAIAKIFEIKTRPADNPLICHFYSVMQLEHFTEKIPEQVQLLMKSFSPGPLSYLLDIPENSPLLFATCGLPFVVARIPSHPVFLSVLEKVNVPLAAPSANTSGKVSPTSASMVEKDLGKKLAGVVNGGVCEVGLESTIIDAREAGQVMILRPGAIGRDEIKTVLPDAKIYSRNTEIEMPALPGMKYRHYAPRTPVYLIESIASVFELKHVAVFLTDENISTLTEKELIRIQENDNHLIAIGSLSNLKQMAGNFYKNLASADDLHVEKSFFLKPDFDDSSLSNALRNRLERIIFPG